MSEDRKYRRRKEARPSEIIEAGMMEFAEKGYLVTRLRARNGNDSDLQCGTKAIKAKLA